MPAYNGATVTSDDIGNTLYDGTRTYTWEHGRQLATLRIAQDAAWNFTYDTGGMRTHRTDGTDHYSYVYNGGQLTQVRRGNDIVDIAYADGRPMSLTLNNDTSYFYVTNLQGDVIALMNTSGRVVVRYTYDAWGNLLSVFDNSGKNLSILNPLRYRGYVYDDEYGLYYLQSRYYDPAIGRFISADGYVSTGQDITGFNMFAYCGNNPVNRVDHTGTFWKEIGDFFSELWDGIKAWANNTFGAESSTTVTIAEIETPIIPDPSPITVITGTQTTQTVSQHGDSSKPISVYANTDAQHPIKSSSAGIKFNNDMYTLDLSVGLDDIGITGSITNGNTTNSFGVILNLSEFKLGIEGSTAIQWDNITETAYTNISVSGWTIIAAYILITTGEFVPSQSYAYSN